MKIKPKKFVYYVERKPHWLSNRQGFFTMERNERVDDFPESFTPTIATRLPRSTPKVNPAKIVLSPTSLPTFFKVILASIYFNVLRTSYHQYHSLPLLEWKEVMLFPFPS